MPRHQRVAEQLHPRPELRPDDIYWKAASAGKLSVRQAKKKRVLDELALQGRQRRERLPCCLAELDVAGLVVQSLLLVR